MLKNPIALMLVVLFLFSCNRKNETQKKNSELTQNQKQIVEWYRIAKSLRNKNHFLIKNYADSIQSLTANETDEFKAIEHIAQGLYYNSINNDSLSFKNYNTSINLLKASKTDSLFVSAYAGLGNYYKHVGDYPKSLKNLLTALKIAENQRFGDDWRNVCQFRSDVFAKRRFASSEESIVKFNQIPTES